jgi:trk system potassium uptake protein TrkH
LFALFAFDTIGTALLMLPVSTASGHAAPFLTAFFTATSGLTTTGLTVETTATYWSFFGQMVILVLMFVGGLGFMAAVTFLLILVRNQFRLPEQVAVHDSLGLPGLGGLGSLMLHIMVLDLVVTAIGIVPLSWRFHDFLPWSSALWQGLFTSVSAFNTAGFDIAGPTSLTPYYRDPYILGTTTAVACVGALGYSVTLELLGRKRWNRLSLNTRLVVIVSVASWVLGSLALFLYERSNPQTLGTMSTPLAVMNASFNGISGSTTTGFSTIDFARVAPPMLLITTIFMFVGGAAGSTAGGTKVNTLSVLLVVAISSLKGRSRAQVFMREVPHYQVLQAVTVWLVATFLVGLSLLLLMAERAGIPMVQIFFEVVSAFGTVGLSTGVLGNLPAGGLYAMIMLMLVGRVGVLTLILAMTVRSKAALYKPAAEEIAIG